MKESLLVDLDLDECIIALTRLHETNHSFITTPTYVTPNTYDTLKYQYDFDDQFKVLAQANRKFKLLFLKMRLGDMPLPLRNLFVITTYLNKFGVPDQFYDCLSKSLHMIDPSMIGVEDIMMRFYRCGEIIHVTENCMFDTPFGTTVPTVDIPLLPTTVESFADILELQPIDESCERLDTTVSYDSVSICIEASDFHYADTSLPELCEAPLTTTSCLPTCFNKLLPSCVYTTLHRFGRPRGYVSRLRNFLLEPCFRRYRGHRRCKFEVNQPLSLPTLGYVIDKAYQYNHSERLRTCIVAQCSRPPESRES